MSLHLSQDVEEVEELALQLDEDIGRAEFLRDRLIPKAVLFFTGEALKDEDDEDDDVSATKGIIVFQFYNYLMVAYDNYAVMALPLLP